VVTLINKRFNLYDPDKNDLRAEVVSTTYGSCDLCGSRCEESKEYDGWTNWSQATAVLKAKNVGWLGRMSGRIQQLICPKCQSMEVQ
jgi:hypothetical protein